MCSMVLLFSLLAQQGGIVIFDQVHSARPHGCRVLSGFWGRLSCVHSGRRPIFFSFTGSHWWSRRMVGGCCGWDFGQRFSGMSLPLHFLS
ncbi:hypothetical protein CPB84DRAFT_1798308 [Gymnopilus junonius]|uniref:Secreted protein n=1 Tax=Gymnopilus junonius TaxID=109634 RepID=A0A9P5NBD2_GYMJU|nr:hypothetical protein CPB84DRAFT_1798308 [Gymnopilus junonius]